MKRTAHFCLSIILFFAGIPGTILAQADLPQPQILEQTVISPNGDTLVIRALDFQQIPEGFSATNRLLAEAGELIESSEQVEKNNQAVDTLFSEINVFLGDTMVVSLTRASVRDMEQVGQRAALYSADMARYGGQIQERSSGLELMMYKLRNEKSMWLLTRESISEENKFASRVQRISRTLLKIDSVSLHLQGELGRAVSLQDRFAEKDERLKDLQKRVRDRKADLTASMFSRDEPGFFGDLYQLKDSTLLENHIRNMKRTLRNDTDILKSEFMGQVILFLVLFLILYTFALWYRHNFAKLVDNEKFELSDLHMNLVYSPLVTMVFVTAMLIRFSLANMPQTFLNLNLLLMSVPIVILMIRMFGRRIRNWLILFFSLYLLTLVYEFFYYPDILQRLILLLISMATLTLFVYILVKDPELEKFHSGLARKLFRFLLFSFSILLLGAVIANLIGAVRLADYLTLLPLRLTMLAIGVQVSVKVFEAITFLFLSSKWAQRAHVIKDGFDSLVKKLNWIIEFFMWAFFLVTALSVFRIKDAVFDWASEFLTKARAIGDAELTIGSILLFIFIIWLSIAITRTITIILDKDVFTRVKTAKGIPSTVILMIRIVLITMGFFLAARAAGMKLDNLSIIIGAFSVGIGFGLQNIFNNMVSGFILAFERPIKVGDVVQVGTTIGEVKTIGLRASTIKSFDGSEVVVPNGNLISNEMINWTLSDSNRRMDIQVGVEYGTDPEKVIELLLGVANAHPAVRKKPLPSAYFTEFADSSLNFRLLAWTHLDIRLTVESELKVAINASLAEAGISVPFPQTDLHIISDKTRPVPEAQKPAAQKPEAQNPEAQKPEAQKPAAKKPPAKK